MQQEQTRQGITVSKATCTHRKQNEVQDRFSESYNTHTHGFQNYYVRIFKVLMVILCILPTTPTTKVHKNLS